MISFVIPCYNESDRLKTTLSDLKTFFSNFPHPYELLFVNDGSTDNTLGILKKAPFPIRVVSYKKNRGKGYAVRKGVAAAKGDLIFMMDCDLATDLKEIASFLKDKNYDVVIGRRTVRKGIRQIGAIVVALLIKVLFWLPVKDTQCGFKMFNRKAAKVFKSMKSDRWAFDVEFLHCARQAGCSIKEKKVAWTEQPGSKVRLHHIFGMVNDLFQIRFSNR
jgi:dolichyl-phosphate beta-glucosyltransferase